MNPVSFRVMANSVSFRVIPYCCISAPGHAVSSEGDGGEIRDGQGMPQDGVHALLQRWHQSVGTDGGHDTCTDTGDNRLFRGTTDQSSQIGSNGHAGTGRSQRTPPARPPPSCPRLRLPWAGTLGEYTEAAGVL